MDERDIQQALVKVGIEAEVTSICDMETDGEVRLRDHDLHVQVGCYHAGIVVENDDGTFTFHPMRGRIHEVVDDVLRLTRE